MSSKNKRRGGLDHPEKTNENDSCSEEELIYFSDATSTAVILDIVLERKQQEILEYVDDLNFFRLLKPVIKSDQVRTELDAKWKRMQDIKSECCYACYENKHPRALYGLDDTDDCHDAILLCLECRIVMTTVLYRSYDPLIVAYRHVMLGASDVVLPSPLAMEVMECIEEFTREIFVDLTDMTRDAVDNGAVFLKHEFQLEESYLAPLLRIMEIYYPRLCDVPERPMLVDAVQKEHHQDAKEVSSEVEGPLDFIQEEHQEVKEVSVPANLPNRVHSFKLQEHSKEWVIQCVPLHNTQVLYESDVLMIIRNRHEECPIRPLRDMAKPVAKRPVRSSTPPSCHVCGTSKDISHGASSGVIRPNGGLDHPLPNLLPDSNKQPPHIKKKMILLSFYNTTQEIEEKNKKPPKPLNHLGRLACAECYIRMRTSMQRSGCQALFQELRGLFQDERFSALKCKGKTEASKRRYQDVVELERRWHEVQSTFLDHLFEPISGVFLHQGHTHDRFMLQLLAIRETNHFVPLLIGLAKDLRKQFADYDKRQAQQMKQQKRHDVKHELEQERLRLQLLEEQPGLKLEDV